MTGINFVDTIVVRRTIEKGTKVIEEPIKKSNWAGPEFKKFQKEKLNSAGDVGLVSGKGTSMIHLSQMRETEIPSTSGSYLSTNRGTKVRMG